MPQMIKVGNDLVEIKITPQLLEMHNVLTRYRNSPHPKPNSFRTNPLKFVQVLCRTYDVNFVKKVEQIRNPRSKLKYSCTIEIPLLHMCAFGIGESKRKAKLNSIFNLHRQYVHLIQEI